MLVAYKNHNQIKLIRSARDRRESYEFEFDSFRLVLCEIKCAFNGFFLYHIYTKLFKFCLNKKNKHETEEKRENQEQVTNERQDDTLWKHHIH